MGEKLTAGIGKGTPGPGRKKGVPNKINGELKSMILGALDDAGGQSYLVQQAKDNPTAFLSLVGKVLPMTIAGDSDNPVKIEFVTIYEEKP
jgi:hypothetical protein